MTDQPQSPFLPGTNIQFAWDSTSLGYLKTCPRLYQYQMILGYQSKAESLHLRFGIEYHTAIEQYHKDRANGEDRANAIRNAVRGLLARTVDWVVDTTTPVGKYKNRQTLLELTVDYLDHIKNDAAELYIKEDGKAAVELSFRFELDWGPKDSYGKDYGDDPDISKITSQPYLLCGHLDQVVSFADNLYVLDHKTSKTTLGEYYFDQYTPNNQMTLYALASQVVIDSPVKGVIIDAAQIKLEEPHAFKRGMALRTPEILDEWLEDLRYWLNQAEAYATAGYWPMNDMACGMYGGCKFREVCSKSPSTRKVYLKSDFKQLPESERWNPLKER
jgi:hypothetical protein